MLLGIERSLTPLMNKGSLVPLGEVFAFISGIGRTYPYNKLQYDIVIALFIQGINDTVMNVIPVQKTT